MCIKLSFMVVVFGFTCFAQEQTLPLRIIVPEDVVQDSIAMDRSSANGFIVRFTFTDVGARKNFVFRRKHEGEKTVTRIGSYESRSIQAPYLSHSARKAANDWRKFRKHIIFVKTKAEAKRILDGLKMKKGVG